MKSTAAFAAMALAVPGLAHAAGTIKGTYSVRYTTLCQSIEDEVFKKSGGSQQTNINTIDEGALEQSIGFITFTPSSAGASSGKLSATLTQAKGSLAILGLPGPPASPAAADMKMKTGTQTGTYALTLATAPNPSTLKITFTGQTVATFTAYPSKLAGAVYGHIDFQDLDDPISGKNHCINTGSADLQ
ncbi:MAG TPA: hypothetical protein VH722_11455 [Alphaproteobacteria bacterium]|jgi:hypothetical protein|nr:hypothetical protein [Alphaproteobacteria bacterium]